jgi:two-component system sporulation sensor kinase B
MKDFNSLSNRKLYHWAILFLISLMFVGLYLVYTRSSQIGFGFLVHLLLVIVLSAALLIYPQKETNRVKCIIIVVGMFYFYTLFILYPETSSTLIFLCLIPGAAILFFQPTLFYFSITLNCFFMASVFVYIFFVDKGRVYAQLYLDLAGNILNFFASQALLFLIFYLSHIRMKKLQLYYEQVQQAERLKTTGQLAAAVAHEIRNPITVVKGFLQFYQEDQSIGKEKKEHFSLMLDELNVAETVISDFLSIARPKGDVESNIVNVKDAIHSVADLINSFALLNNITIRLDVQNECYITCSLMEFKQLMINLLKNAIEASPHESSIMITAKEKNKYIEIYVVDSGCGMTDKELSTIGTPFYSLKSKGTGLGLMICFNIVQKYNGSIQFHSEEGKGTRVTIRFPSKKEK